MSYSSSVTTVLQKCPEFTNFNLIATWKLSWVVYRHWQWTQWTLSVIERNAL